MGLKNFDRATYLSINADGKFARKVTSPVEGSVQRTNKRNQLVNEVYYDSLSGFITKLEKVDHPEFGLQWKIFLKDGDDKFIITLGYVSNTAKALLKMFPNIDLSKEVSFAPSMKEEDGNKNVSLFLYQDSKLVPYAFKNDDPKGMPERQLVKDPKTGKDTWSYVDQVEWLNGKAQESLAKISSEEAPSADEAEETADGEQPVAKAKSLDDF